MRNLLDIILRILGAIMLGMIALGLFSKASSQPATGWWQREILGKKPYAEKYQFTWGKAGVWLGDAVAGTLWAGRERYHANPYIFESRWGVDPYSFFGSKAWERNYVGNRYQGSDGSKNAHKPEWGNSFRDIHHFTGASSRLLLVGGTFVLAANHKQRLRHRVIDRALGMLVFSATASATYSLLR